MEEEMVEMWRNGGRVLKEEFLEKVIRELSPGDSLRFLTENGQDLMIYH